MTYVEDSKGSQPEMAGSIFEGWLAAQQRPTAEDRMIRVASNEELRIIRLLARRLSLHNCYRNDQAKFNNNNSWFLAGQEAAEYAVACNKWNLRYLFPPEILSNFDELVYQMTRNQHLPLSLYQKVALVEKTDEKRKLEAPADIRAQLSFLFNYVSPYGHPTTVSATKPICDEKFLEVWIDLRHKQERIFNKKGEPHKGALNRDIDQWINVWKQSLGGRTESRFDGKAVFAREMDSDLLLVHINLGAPKTRVIYPQLNEILTHYLSSYQGEKIEPPKLHLKTWESCFDAYDLTENQRLTEEDAAFRIGIEITTLHERKKKAYEMIYGEPYVVGRARKKRHLNEILPCANCTDEICSRTRKACEDLENWLAQFTLPLDTKNPNRFDIPSKHKNAKPDEERAATELREYLSYPPSTFEWDKRKRNLRSDYVPPERLSFVYYSHEVVSVFWRILRGQCLDQNVVCKNSWPEENDSSSRWGVPYNWSVPYHPPNIECDEEREHPVDQYGRCKHLRKRDKCSICAPPTSRIFRGEKEKSSDAISDLAKVKQNPLYLTFHTPKKSILKLPRGKERAVQKEGRRRYQDLWEQTVAVKNKWGILPSELWPLQLELQKQYLRKHSGRVTDKSMDPRLSTKKAKGFIRGTHGPRNVRTTYTRKDLDKLFGKENLPDRTFIGDIFQEQSPEPHLDYEKIEPPESRRKFPILIEDTLSV